MTEMNTDATIYVAGHGGLVGSALVRCLRAAGYKKLLLRSHADLDLTSQYAVQRFFSETRPEYVFVAAAKVGGIVANNSAPADFIFDNVQIATNVIHEAYRNGVKRLLFLGSSCAYPKLASQPMKEDCLLTGPLEITNRPYAVAKIAGIEMCWAYNRQYGTEFLAAMPTNLFGPNDNYDPKNSHVIAALIRKCHEAKVNGDSSIVIWGTGNPRREFLYSDDAADACVFLMNLPRDQFKTLIDKPDGPPLVNVGWGQDLTIRELAEMTADVVGSTKTLTFDPTKPDGTPRKLLDVSVLRSLGWSPATPLRSGLEKTYLDYCSQVSSKLAVGSR
jgi:GDP-L-fucose synthase